MSYLEMPVAKRKAEQPASIPSRQTISVTCDPENRLRRVPTSSLTAFQGQMKELRKEQYDQLKQSILSKGFFAPVFVWQNNIVDGHQRLFVLQNEGWEVEGGIPVVDIQADNEKDAAEKLLLLSSTYGKVDSQGLYEFTQLHGIDLREFTLPDLPDFDVDVFKAEFYGSGAPPGEGDGEVDGAGIDVECPMCGHKFKLKKAKVDMS